MSTAKNPAAILGAMPADAWDVLLRVTILIFLGSILYVSIVSYAFEPVAKIVERHEWSQLIVRPSALWLVMGMVLLAFRTLLWY
ncbi:MAG TPA: hypothetical protein DIC36_05105, partial [Gammaproteobacteria bacterium]|nr:hypothetical protein [Gammaproteobacteria bacterium]